MSRRDQRSTASSEDEQRQRSADRRDRARPRPDGESRDPTDGTLGRRIAAFLVDTLLVGSIAALATRRSESPLGRAAATGLLAAVLGFVYHVALEGRTGRTAGKRICGLRVVRTDGRPCDYRAATVRTAGRFLDALPVGYLIGLLSIRRSNWNQRVGDRLAGTVVRRTDRSRRPSD